MPAVACRGLNERLARSRDSTHLKLDLSGSGAVGASATSSMSLGALRVARSRHRLRGHGSRAELALKGAAATRNPCLQLDELSARPTSA